VRPAPDAVPLRPVLDHLAVAIEDDDHMLPAPVDARAAVAAVRSRFAEARGCARRLAGRHATAGAGLGAGPDLRKPGCAVTAPHWQRWKLALLRHEHPVGTLGEHVSRL